MELPRYLIIGARPVKLVRTPHGDMDCLALDFETGDLVRNLDYLARAVMADSPDTNIVSEDVFDRSVQALTAQKRSRWQRHLGKKRDSPLAAWRARRRPKADSST